jgi:hypothetical protein
VEILQPTEEQPSSSQLEELTDVIHESQPMLFSLSEEFEFMLRECDSSDVLQLIRDNWHHYSQWIEGAHMKWQSEEFVTASTTLRSKISASNVRTLRGPLPLHDTVLANLDAHLDSSKSIPVIELPDPESPEWNLLSYFDVVMKGDVSYYLRCLIAISNDDKPDTDLVTYIYEQLQSKYTGNEELIRSVGLPQIFFVTLIHLQEPRFTAKTLFSSLENPNQTTKSTTGLEWKPACRKVSILRRSILAVLTSSAV